MNIEKVKVLWKKPWIKNLVFFGIMGVLFFTPVGQWARIKMTSLALSSPSNTAGNKANDDVFSFPFQLENSDRDRLMLDELRGRHVFINYWASWCVPCLAEFSSLESFQSNFPDVEFVYLTRGSKEEFDAYMDKTSHKLAFYRQLSRTPPQMEHQSIPASYLIGPDGDILFRHIGAANWDDVETINEFKALLKG